MNRILIVLWSMVAIMLVFLASMVVVRKDADDSETGYKTESRAFNGESRRRVADVAGRPDVDNRAVASAESSSERNEEDVPGPDEPPPLTQAEIDYEEWEKLFDRLVKYQDDRGEAPSQKQIADFKSAFDKLSDDVKLENIPHAQNLFSDLSIGYLTAILYDVNEPKDVLESIFHDILNRPEELKMPIIRKIVADEKHPLSEDALDILVITEDPSVK